MKNETTAELNKDTLIAVFKRNIAMHENGPVLSSDQFSSEVKTEMNGFIRGLKRGLEIVELTEPATSQIAALRSALEMVEKIEQCAQYCQVCGVHKGDNRGCFAHRGAKGHKWAFQAHIKETELLAFKKALAATPADHIADIDKKVEGCACEGAYECIEHENRRLAGKLRDATPADPAKCSECGHVKHDGMLCRAAAGFDAICECFPSADPVREAATALVEQIDRQLTFNIPERFVLALKTALEAK